QLVYDNYNALAIGFSPTQRASDVIVSLALYPRWVTLFFLQAVRTQLPDPSLRLVGSGKAVRSLRLAAAETLDEPDVRALIAEAAVRASVPFDPQQPVQTIIKSVSLKRRPRRPAR
ncbi:MAG: hypothetical protein KC416_13350, partial [Myxococcales bacterium]|nr:hypothetical protein [Myxococcales bacterium]